MDRNEYLKNRYWKNEARAKHRRSTQDYTPLAERDDWDGEVIKLPPGKNSPIDEQ
jgi:hypothetical protein